MPTSSASRFLAKNIPLPPHSLLNSKKYKANEYLALLKYIYYSKKILSQFERCSMSTKLLQKAKKEDAHRLCAQITFVCHQIALPLGDDESISAADLCLAYLTFTGSRQQQVLGLIVNQPNRHEILTGIIQKLFYDLALDKKVNKRKSTQNKRGEILAILEHLQDEHLNNCLAFCISELTKREGEKKGRSPKN
jgi:hypothetical protein